MKLAPNRYLHTINMFRECQNLNTIGKNTGIKTYRFKGFIGFGLTFSTMDGET
jgi:hypothetical protein